MIKKDAWEKKKRKEKKKGRNVYEVLVPGNAQKFPCLPP
jgi:hypothetical protein